ncbi:MAG: nicotinate-nucleotide adenylyltransferase [Lachnospiraceae bacterium]|jgi:nicotinate-nucleotide adenylyltransferase|nr:nicotinate-nucleotide adenylyltransferase [Lachnospiraceae bacterium]
MGGTFDPVHLGHLILAETALDAEGLDEVRFIPSGHSYFKDSRQDKVSSGEDRLAMTRLAVADNPAFTVSDIEIERSGNTYTFETLEALRMLEPDTEFYFIAGADSILAMRTWKDPARIFSACTVLAAVRETADSAALQEEIRALERDFDARIRLLPMKNIQISSTDIRESIRNGHSVKYQLPDAVIAYIEKRGLYRG